MKALVRTTLALFMTIGIMSATAQSCEEPRKRPSAEDMAAKRSEMMTRELGLNETQKQQVYDLCLKGIKERESRVRKPDGEKSTEAQREAHKAEMKKKMEAHRAEMKKILTDEQFAKWEQSRNKEGEKMRKGHAHHAKKGHGPKPGGERGERPSAEDMAAKRSEMMTRELGLNETQKQQVYDLCLKGMKERETRVRKPDGEKPTEAQREAHRAEMKQKMEAHKAEMKKILNDEQFAKWEQMQKKHAQGMNKGHGHHARKGHGPKPGGPDKSKPAKTEI